MSVNCNNYESFFSSYLDGELDQEARDALRFHLNGCFRCRTKLNDMERTVSVMHGLASARPGPHFDQVLRSRLHEERTREVYTRPFWARVNDAAAEMRDFSRNRSVQFVFAASLLLTVGVLGTLSWKQPSLASRSMATAVLFAPTPVEPAPASWHLIAPLPVDPQPAPPMAIAASVQREDHEAVRPIPVLMGAGETVERPERSPAKNIITIRTMEPQASLVSQGNAGTELRTAPLTGQPADRDLYSQPSSSAFDLGIASAGGNRTAGTQQFWVPPASKRRITRISF
jgi:hypothetical protein